MNELTNKLTAAEKVTKAIISLQKPYPFFAHLSLNMKIRAMPENDERFTQRTMCVSNCGEMFYDEGFVMEIPQDQMLGVITHECLHLAFLHPHSLGHRDRFIANIAQDLVINKIIIEQGLSLPSGIISVDRYSDTGSVRFKDVTITVNKLSKKIWEEVYEEIYPQLKDKSPSNPKGDYFVDGDGEDGEGEGQGQRGSEGQVQKWQRALADAAAYAKSRGLLPSGMDRLIDDLLNPKVKWSQHLMKYIKPHLNPVDFTYQKPSKKSQLLGIYLPNVRKEHCIIEVVVDVSGSICQRELTEFLTECVAIATAFQNVEMWVSFCDTEIHERIKVDNGDIPKILAMKVVGGGGTKMESSLNYIKEHNRDANIVLVMTDGYDSYDKQERDYPFDVIWVITQGGIVNNIKYGQVIKME